MKADQICENYDMENQDKVIGPFLISDGMKKVGKKN